MANPSPLYRREALERYLRERERTVLPQLMSPSAFALLWTLCALLLGGSFVSWLARVPEFESGSAVAVRAPGDGNGMVLLAFFPSESLARLRSGQTAFVRASENDRPQPRAVLGVHPTVLSPESLRSRYGAATVAAAGIEQPASLVYVKFAPLAGALPPQAYPGSVYTVTVRTGSRRLLSFFTVQNKLPTRDPG